MVAKKMTEEEEKLQTKENRMLINFNYAGVVLPYADGVAVINALSKAEKYDQNDYKNPKITPIKKDTITTNLMSHKDYAEMKMRTLLLGTDEPD
jgi:hypothetical protein